MSSGAKVNKSIGGFVVVVALAIDVGVVAFIALRPDGTDHPSVAPAERSDASAARADETLPALPTPSLPANAEDAKVLMEVTRSSSR